MIKSVLPEIESRLEVEYRKRLWKPHGTALDVLISAILSQNTSDLNSSRAFKSLRKSFSGYEEIACSNINTIIKSIASGGLARMKAGYIKYALKKTKVDKGEYSLESLSKLNIKNSLEYLASFKGVGEKTAACVLLFAFNKRIMPVDTHIHRITLRLGFVDQTQDRRKTFNFWFGQTIVHDYYNTHLNMVKHGRNTCVARKPKCEVCVLNDLCAYFKKR